MLLCAPLLSLGWRGDVTACLVEHRLCLSGLQSTWHLGSQSCKLSFLITQNKELNKASECLVPKKITHIITDTPASYDQNCLS